MIWEREHQKNSTEPSLVSISSMPKYTIKQIAIHSAKIQAYDTQVHYFISFDRLP